MLAVICIPDFLLQAALRLEGDDLQSGPVALIAARENPEILQLTAAAWAMGVQPGMTITQAKARCPDLIIKARSAAQERSAQETLLHCAWSVSPRVEATAEGVCTLDLKGHRDVSCESLAATILRLLVEFRLIGQVGIAANPLLAWHAARAARPCLIVDDSKEFLAALPIESIDATLEILSVLQKWGIQTLGDFLALPRHAVTERLGKAGFELFERAVADFTRPLCLIDPPEHFEETMDFEHEVETAPALLFVLHRFVQQLALRFQLLGFVAEQMTLRLSLTDTSKYERILNIPAPTAKVDTLFGMLQTHLEMLRTEHPIVGVSLAFRPCRDTNEQLDLFEDALRDPNLFYETLARLTALIGHARIGMPVAESTHRPDAFRLQAVDLNRSWPRPEPVLERRGLPLRRHRPSHGIHVQCAEGKPIRLNVAKAQEAILKARGPWRISGDWWDTQCWSRAEWDIQTEHGNLYRLFQNDSGWFVDGAYD